MWFLLILLLNDLYWLKELCLVDSVSSADKDQQVTLIETSMARDFMQD